MNDLVHSASLRPTEDAVVGGHTPGPWSQWADKRPNDTTKLYRWRIPERLICGAMLRPEWTEKLTLVGMGYSDNEWWPLSPSHWNGYHRRVPAGLEWRLADEGETEVFWAGLDLLPDPWTGQPPKVRGKHRYIGAACYEIEGIWLVHSFGSTGAWSDISKLSEAWNRRAAISKATGGSQ